MTKDFEIENIAIKLQILINEEVQDRLDDSEMTDYENAVMEVVEIINNTIRDVKENIEYCKQNDTTLNQLSAESELSICLSIKEEMMKWSLLLKMLFENNDGGIIE